MFIKLYIWPKIKTHIIMGIMKFNGKVVIFLGVKFWVFDKSYDRRFVWVGNCKDPIWFPSPKVKRILTQRAQYNEFVESGSENYALMNWTTIMVGLDDLKAKINRFYPKKIVLGTIWEDVFLYKSLLNLITNLVPIVTVFFLSFSSIPFPHGLLSILFILSSFFHLHPPRVD